MFLVKDSARILLAKAVLSQSWDILGWFCGSFFVHVGDGELQPIISTEINCKMTVGVSVGVMICSLKILCLAVDAAHVSNTVPTRRRGNAAVET